MSGTEPVCWNFCSHLEATATLATAPWWSAACKRHTPLQPVGTTRVTEGVAQSNAGGFRHCRSAFLKQWQAGLLGVCLSLGSASAPCWAAAAPSPTPQHQWTVSDDLQIEQLADGLWQHISWQRLTNGQRYPSNGLIVNDGAQLLLIDTAWGTEPTRQLLDWIDRELQKPIALVIPTHFHDDRIGGWPVLAARAIPLAASPQTLQLAEAEHITAIHDPALDTLTVGGAVRIGPVEVFSPGPGHSPDNLVVWVPSHDLLFGGCAVKSMTSGIGNIADADLSQWPASIRRIQLRYPQIETVVPGHLASGSRALLDHTLQVLNATR